MNYLAQIALAATLLGAGVFIGKTFFSEQTLTTTEVCQVSELERVSHNNLPKSANNNANIALSCESEIKDAYR